MDWYNDRSVCRGEEMGFQFWLKRREGRQMPDRERKGVPEHRSNVFKGSLPQGPPVHPRNTADASILRWAKKARRRVEMKQLPEVWRRSCRPYLVDRFVTMDKNRNSPLHAWNKATAESMEARRLVPFNQGQAMTVIHSLAGTTLPTYGAVMAAAGHD